VFANSDELLRFVKDEGVRFVEFLLQAETSVWTWNDFSSTSSLWTVTLSDEGGRVVAPVELTVAPGKAESWNVLFPPVTPFTRTWRIRFPRTLADGKPLIGPATRSLTLRFAGPLGQAALRVCAIIYSPSPDAPCSVDSVVRFRPRPRARRRFLGASSGFSII